MNLTAEVDAALTGTGTIERSEILRWMQGDLVTRAHVYYLTASAWSRIEPELSMDEQCGFIADYLLECIAVNPQSDDDLVHTGFDAGYSLSGWAEASRHAS